MDMNLSLLSALLLCGVMVTDGRFYLLARLSAPFYARDAQHFSLVELNKAWDWLGG